MSKLSLAQVKMLAELLGMEYGQSRVDAYREGDIDVFDSEENPSPVMSALMTILHSDLHYLTAREQSDIVTVFVCAWQAVTSIYHNECMAKCPRVGITNYHEATF